MTLSGGSLGSWVNEEKNNKSLNSSGVKTNMSTYVNENIHLHI